MTDTTYVILAAGRGSRIGRIGDSLHKALVPVGGRAAVTHIIEAFPADARIVVGVGYQAPQVEEFLELAYPRRDITCVRVPWDDPNDRGPGSTLLALRDHVPGAFVLTMCDTLWERDMRMWHDVDRSWVGVASMPTGTTPERWCRVVGESSVRTFIDKRASLPEKRTVFTGLAFVAAADSDVFWAALAAAQPNVGGERQVTPGLAAVARHRDVRVRRIRWTDIGDEHAYRAAVAKMSGYDFTKVGQATYVMPNEGLVIKFHRDISVTRRRYERGRDLQKMVPFPVKRGTYFVTYPYTPGVSGYVATDWDPYFICRVIDWYESVAMSMSLSFDPQRVERACTTFYHDKTYARLAELRPELVRDAHDAVDRIAWPELYAGACAGQIHGDMNLSNLIYDTTRDCVVAIDWREDFGPDAATWGDQRYDYAKFLSGLRVHWERAQAGDFRPWDKQAQLERIFWQSVPPYVRDQRKNVSTIAALSLLNSAPLHAAPLDEVLVSRGTAWLEELGW